MHAFDRQTDIRKDRRTEFSSLDRVCIGCSAVKMIINTLKEFVERAQGSATIWDMPSFDVHRTSSSISKLDMNSSAADAASSQ